MTTIVIMPGGFHPFHAGHAALYQSAQRAFPDADVYVAATDDVTTRPFPFQVKEKLAQLAGVNKGRFMRVKSPFKAEEITAPYNPAKDILIFVRSEKDSTKPPQPGGIKKDGSPAYLQPLLGAKKLEPFAKHAYMAYLPTVEFGPGMTSATEIRAAWPTLNEKRKTALVMSLYPKTQTNPRLAATAVKLLDTALGVVDESALDNLPRPNKRNQFKSLHKQRKERGLDEQGVAEGSDDPWGDQGRFAGDTPVSIGGATVKPLQVGDTVRYFGQLAKILAMSKTGNTSRITIANNMGGVTKDVLTSDLKRTGLNEFALPGGDDREPDEEHILRQLAAQWWLGTEQQMARAQQTLAAMGWEIGQDESGDDDAGVFVIRVGDENGNSYIAFNHSDLEGLNENQGWAATFTNEDDYIEEKWSSKYKSSINCAAPRGFSQRAHCAGRKK
jgi:hypothetical protein